MLKLLGCNLFFFLPFFYFFKTRLKELKNKISWLFIYIIPILLMIFVNVNVNVNVTLVISIFLYILSVYAVYEMGYIWNDAETIKREDNPTLRLSKDELNFYNKNKKLIYTFRLLIVFIFSFYFIDSSIYYFYIVNMFTILILYLLYNNIRNRLNLPLHFLLVCFRFVTPVIAFSPINFLWVIFVFPVINLLERASEKRFSLKFFQDFLLSNKKQGRYIYYIILFFACVIYDSPISILVTVLYLFSYRFFSYEFIRLRGNR